MYIVPTGSHELAAGGIALSFQIATGYSVVLGLSGGLTVTGDSPLAFGCCYNSCVLLHFFDWYSLPSPADASLKFQQWAWQSAQYVLLPPHWDFNHYNRALSCRIFCTIVDEFASRYLNRKTRGVCYPMT